MVKKVGALLSLAKEDNGVVRVALGGRLSQLHSTLTGLSAAASRSPTTSPPGPLLPGRPLPPSSAASPPSGFCYAAGPVREVVFLEPLNFCMSFSHLISMLIA